MSLRKHVEPELGQGRIDAQWVRIHERMPAPKRRSQTVRWAFVAMTACAAMALAWFEPFAPPAPSVWEGSLVASDDAPVDLTLSEGSRIQLDPRSEVGLLQSSPSSVQLALGHGSARFEVAKKRSRRFSVRSGVVEVLVTGTKFTVARTATSDGERVRVAVEEGSVEVHREGQGMVRLGAGEHWSTLVETPKQTATAPLTASEADSEATPEGEREPRERRESRARPRSSASEAELLFERANVARRAGLLRDAAALFEELVQKHEKDRHAALSAFELGRMRMDSFGDMRGAITALERALSLDERRSFAEDALARLALAHDAVGDKKSCARVRERYLARYADGVHAQYLLERCRER